MTPQRIRNYYSGLNSLARRIPYKAHAQRMTTVNEPMSVEDKRTSVLLADFKRFCRRIDRSNLEHIARVYTQDIEFHDPLLKARGILALRGRMKNLYARAEKINFVLDDEVISDNSAILTWHMHCQHSVFARRKAITLRGSTYILFTDRIYFQENFYDSAALTYQRIPVLRFIVKAICPWG